LALAADARALLLRLPALRGGPEVLQDLTGPATAALDGLRRCYAQLVDQGVADRIIIDLGLVRDLGYYTGAVFEVYDPAVGFAIGGGGRYDELLGRFGRALPACGIALDIHRVHIAQLEEGRR
jgi:ATP phosphoribosyltransferase regulatory subunit